MVGGGNGVTVEDGVETAKVKKASSSRKKKSSDDKDKKEKKEKKDKKERKEKKEKKRSKEKEKEGGVVQSSPLLPSTTGTGDGTLVAVFVVV